jgi:hypothetical protein
MLSSALVVLFGLRTAANSRAADTCSSLNVGNSSTIPADVRPAASYSNTSTTVMRVPT